MHTLFVGLTLLASFFLPSHLLLKHVCTCTCIWKVTALGVLHCFALFVCLTLLASFFLPSHLSFKNMYMESDCLGCAALLCLVVCLTLLALFFLPSTSLCHVHTYYTHLRHTVPGWLHTQLPWTTTLSMQIIYTHQPQNTSTEDLCELYLHYVLFILLFV